MSRRPLFALLAAAALVGSGTLTASAASTQDPPEASATLPDGAARLPAVGLAAHGTAGGGAVARASGAKAPSSKVQPSLAAADGTVAAFVELDTASVAEATEGESAQASRRTAASVRDRVERLAQDVVPHQAKAGATPGKTPSRLAVTTNVVPGTLVVGDAARIRALASDDDVAAVYLVTPRTLSNKGTDAFTNALATWQATHETGKGVRIGIIDGGLDYTHADFGGSGTAADYATAWAARDARAIPSAVPVDHDKVADGWDFAGPTYNADSTDWDTWDPFPAPDGNPIEAKGEGHGTHVAGTAAGYGVQADGTTFRGDYSTLTDLSGWRVGPGSAPEATLYPLKIFGDGGGSTDLVLSALDWAADPNGDGDLSDHLDIVNMSLGGDDSPADDPENLFVDELTDLGVLSVVAGGNAGDLTDVGGSPGDAPSALTVAASVGGTQTLDGVRVTSGDLAGTYAGQESADYTGSATSVTAEVYAPRSSSGAQLTGCSAFSAADAALLKGKIAYLSWTEPLACGSKVRFDNAAKAGAVGVLLTGSSDVFDAGIAGNATLPGTQLTGTATKALHDALLAGGVSVEIGPALAGTQFTSTGKDADTLAPFSSRGVHGSLGLVKPDVAAPGTAIASAQAGGGTAAAVLSGTSMATPHVTGVAALVRQAHPTWTAQQVKAAVMNTAVHDVRTAAGVVYGPERVGSGRVDALLATQGTTLAYSTQQPDQVSVSYGVVSVGSDTISQRQAVTVENLGDAPVTYDASFAATTAPQGASLAVTTGAGGAHRVTVPAHGRATLTLTLTLDPARLTKTLDPTSDATADGHPRDFAPSFAGRLVLTPVGSDGPALRVPVQASPRLESDMASDDVTFSSPAAASATLPLEGTSVHQGGWTSLVAPLALVRTSPRLERTDATTTSVSAAASGDIRAVGFTSTALRPGVSASKAVMAVGVSVDGEWARLGTAMAPVVDIDVDGDGWPDYETWVERVPGADLTVTTTYALFDDESAGIEYGDVVDQQPVNGVWGDVDAGVTDGSTVLLPISLSALRIQRGQKPELWVGTASPYAPDGSGVVDEVDPFTVDPWSPTLWFDAPASASVGSLLFVDSPSSKIQVHRRSSVTSAKLLALHVHDDQAYRAQVSTVTVKPSKVTVTAASVRSTYGTAAKVKVAVTGATAPPSGSVTLTEHGKKVGTGKLTVRGRAGTATVALPPRLAVGTHRVTVSYAGTATTKGGSTTTTVKVAKAPTKVALARSSWTVSKGSRATVKVTVSTTKGLPRATGKVVVKVGSKTVATKSLRNGAVTVRLPAAARTAVVRVVYKGSSTLASSSATKTLHVR